MTTTPSAVTTASNAGGTSTPAVTSASSSAPVGDLPTYDQVKQVFFNTTGDLDKAACARASTDTKVYITTEGTYTRFVCDSIGRFQYIKGAETYAKQWPTFENSHVNRSVFRIPGELIVVPTGANHNLAPAVKAACSCGEVIEQTA